MGRVKPSRDLEAMRERQTADPLVEATEYDGLS